ncbi:putative leucine-rich repeat domain superfamily, F-box-like domain superfamily [Helianthus annuus]|uniref:Leucine-rich repeat domain superfamily, F-box-like domain superfamily n=1 Tax=Helianthus annuus TaxID=4232 RepID=A0A9K3IKY9_HELAN|nr:putative F-box/LRR-repeat protein At5g02700 [Helianthus annuus]KAF5798540.1 putative leucine-rich repeat domain superfamily, F-box-like domain superfamily [Helianthus annuus]KAJ0904649.1 putative leucine-rich repeat domain superfamily, F-box-like domain superfamily [Helianthus annuus]
MDRISELPESIIHHILSFCSVDGDLVRMSVLSKTWFHLTASFPVLNFYMGDFEFRSRESFFKYIEYTTSRFCHQNLTADSLVLSLTLQEPEELYIFNKCLELVLQKGVEALHINLLDSPNVPKYRLPNTLLSVSMLIDLTLIDCELPSSLMVDTIKFKSLMFLELNRVRIDDEMITYLTTSCPLLQVFHIDECHGFKRFCVYGHQNLQEVIIAYRAPVEKIDIEAPNLTKIEVADYVGRKPPQMSLASCKKLTSVSYNGYSNGFPDFLSNFPFVENLALVSTSKSNNLKLSSHSLRALWFCSFCDLDKIELSTPNLGLFIYSCDDWYIYSYNAWYIYSVIKHLPHLKACMRCYANASIDARWFQKLRLFLDKKNGFKALNLYIYTDEKLIVLEKTKEIELPPYELEHIELHFENRESSDHAAFVDAVLCCFRPRSLTLRSSFSLTDFEEQSALVKFTYEKLLEQEFQGHTNIQIVSPYSSKAQKQFKGLMSLPTPLPRQEKAISFIKEEE